MAINRHNILTLDIESLLNGDHHYVIPVYQRNYAWQEGEITQLIQDIIDYIPDKREMQDYYIGTLVTYERRNGSEKVYETIDGQQRITTLILLTSAIRHIYPEVALPWFKKINLEFSSRKTATDTLYHIYQYGDFFSSDYEWNEGIVNGFELCQELLRKKLSENDLGIQAFSDYLFRHVKILRVTVPEDTDLNHYFEIMNNRGEQLEKHEILKSTFLELLNELEEPERSVSLSAFNQVWESCANMEKYIQYGFTVDQRQAVFGLNDWNTLGPADFFELTQKLNTGSKTADNELTRITLTDIIQGKTLKAPQIQIDESPERFNSVINFPNFLLQVLRIFKGKDIPLDDKRLISTFEAEIKEADDKIRFAQDFGFELLRCKFQFDKYIIKREFIGGVDRWSLKRLKWYKDNKVSYVNTFGNIDDEMNDENRSILMLLSMFHVSTPTLVYKHWLNAALLYIMKKGDFIDVASYKNYLIALARSFVFDRFLSNANPRGYFDIIYKSSATIHRTKNQLNITRLSFNQVENLIFNYLDYLLWEQLKRDNKQINQFEFSFRSSVEHYYPRNPMQGYRQLKTEALDSFGNLCLISHSKNSKLSNQPPIAKRSHYNKQNLDSIKQWVMMEDYDADIWNENDIADHENKMIELLTREMDSNFGFIPSVNGNNANDENKAWRWFNQFKNDPQNKSLLARAIFSFGDITYESGYSNYMDSRHPKYFLYNWDYIQSSESFNLFCEFVNTQKPSGLSGVIQYNLTNNKSLINDAYRFSVVKHPEVWEYCEQGYFTWVNGGEIILLHQRERNTDNGSIDLIILLLANWFKGKFYDNISLWREGFSVDINLNQKNGSFEFMEEGEGKGEFIIDCEEAGKIKCHVKPNRNASNSLFVQQLQKHGWQIAYENYFQRGTTSTIIVLEKEYEKNFDRATEKIESIIKNGLGITS
jgi:hypothetical protein